jgi:hypothetical protein
MKKIYFSAVIILCIISSLSVSGQEEEKKYDLHGYLSLLPQYMWTKDNNYKQTELHNRINFFWYPTESLTFTAQLRTQLQYGDFVKMEAPESGIKTQGYFFPLSFNQTFGEKGLLSMVPDRLYMEYNHNKWDVKIGRQRINWGQTFVWNPNDIFNTYSFFDFDYTERPGADALRVQYYTGAASYFDAAVKIDSANKITAAGLYKFNIWSCDIQFLAGYYGYSNTTLPTNEKDNADIVAGFAFTWDFKGVSLRTEGSYFHPLKDSPDSDNVFLISTGLDYTLENQLSLSTEFLFLNRSSMPLGSDILAIYAAPLTVKSMAFTKYNLFAQAGYPITPLLNATLAGMLFRDKKINGYFIGPNIDFSVRDNISLSLFFQFFSLTIKDLPIIGDYTSKTNIAAIRLKWNF